METYAVLYGGIIWSWDVDLDQDDVIQDFELADTQFDGIAWSEAYEHTEGHPMNVYGGLTLVKLYGEEDPPEKLVPAWMVLAMQDAAKDHAYEDYGKWLGEQRQIMRDDEADSKADFERIER